MSSNRAPGVITVRFDAACALAVAAATAGFALSFCPLIPDLNYKIRQFWIDNFQPAEESDDGSTVMLACCNRREVDHNYHMNNAAYMYQLNFARRKHFTAVGLWAVMNTHKRNLIVAAQTIRYRKEILLGQEYVIKTKIIGYSNSNSAFWVQTQFEEPDTQDVLAIHILKYKLVNNNPLGEGRDFPPSLLLIEVGLGDIVAAGKGDVDVIGNVPVVDACAPMNILHKI